MKILVVTQQHSGVGYHRLMLPVYFMKKTYALFTDVLSEDNLKEGFDILLINRFVHGEDASRVLELKEKYGFRLIVDVDDFWILDPWHILHDVYPTQKVIDHIKIADVVTCTHERLAAEIRPLNPNVEILPNALPFGEDQFTDVRTESEKFRFVYAGSITHQKDLELLRNPLKRLASDPFSKKLEFVLCGYNPEEKLHINVWHSMIRDFTCAFRLGFTRATLPTTEYMNFYNDADATIVPLIGSKFNSMKSNLKLLEAAAKKIPVIASNVQPYDDAPHILKVTNQTEWFPAIKKIASDYIYSKEMGQANFEWANEHFNLLKINEKRRQIYAGD